MYVSAVTTQNKKEVIVWERSSHGRDERRFEAPYYFYIQHSEGMYKDIYGNKLTKLEFDDHDSFKRGVEHYSQRGEKIFESDIRPENKILATHYHDTELPATHFTFFDIEVDYDKKLGFKDVDDRSAPINAIAIHHYWSSEDYVLAIPPKHHKGITIDDLAIADEYPNVKIELFENEKSLLKRFFELISDSDIVSGWNSGPFDVPYVYERAKTVWGEKFANTLCFQNAPPPRYREVFDKKGMVKTVLDLFGRESVDYLEIFKKFEVVNRRSFALESVAEEFCPDLEKLEYEGSLYDLYRNDFSHFIRYNIRDCEILKALEDKLGYMRLAIQFAHSSTGLLRDVAGTIKLAELAIINFCHNNLDAKVPNSTYDDNGSSEKFTGALVLPPKVGMHDWVASVDVASLYPSAIRTVNISPDTIVGQFFDNHKAFNAIFAESNEQLYFKYENGDIVEKPANEWKKTFQENEYSISGYGSVFSLKKQGFIPAILTNWFNQRKSFKKLAAIAKKEMEKYSKDTGEYLIQKNAYEKFHRLQYVFKIRLNSLYGALGNKYFKFYDVRLAESTTRSGQEVLMHMVRTVAENLDGVYAYPSESTIYSDTDSCYFLTHAQTEKDAMRVGKIIEKRVNKSFKSFCANAFLSTEAYNDLISAELDVIASKSIFIKKKYYVMQLVYADGAPTDKTKLMGVQLKKTTIPKPIAVTLTKFVQELLKGRPWQDIANDIVSYQEFIVNDAPVALIGLPKGINGIEAKEEEYRAGNTNVSLSGHAAASIFYNLCLEQYQDTESMQIASGMKIKTYYLTKKFGRFNSIALPVDLNRIPSWFEEHFSGLIDRERQSEVLISKPLSSILTAIDQIVPTRQSILFDELVSY